MTAKKKPAPKPPVVIDVDRIEVLERVIAKQALQMAQLETSMAFKDAVIAQLSAPDTTE